MENDKIRVQIKNMMDDSYYGNYDASSILLTENIFNIYSNYSGSTDKYKDIILGYIWNLTQVIYLDTYKYLNYKEKNLILPKEEEDILKILNNIDGELDLRTKFSDEPDIYSLMITYCYNFICLPDYVKYLAFKHLNKSDNIFLSELCPLHRNDLKNSLKTVNLDYIMKQYLKLVVKSYKDSDSVNEYEIIEKLNTFIKKSSIVGNLCF